MLRMLVRTLRRRLTWLVFAVALAWTVWAVWPPLPEARWSLPAGETGNGGFTPDGRTVITYRLVSQPSPGGGSVTVTQTGPLVGRDVETGRERYRALEAGTPLEQVELTSDGRHLTALADGKNLIVLDTADGRQLATLADVNLRVDNRAGASRMWFSEYVHPISPDGRWIAYRPQGGDVRLFDLSAGHEGPILAGARPPMNFSRDGTVLAAQMADGHLGFWDVATGVARAAPADRGPNVIVSGLWFAPDGRTLAAIVQADPAPKPPPPPVPGRPMVSGMPLMTVALWDVATGARRPDLPTPGPGRSMMDNYLTFSPDGRFLAAPSDSRAYLWDLTADPPAVVPLAPAATVAPVRWWNLPLLTPDGSGALTATGPRELTLFDLTTHERRQSYRLWHEQISFGRSASFSPDGRRLLVDYSTGSWLEQLLDRARRWLRPAARAPGYHTVVGTFDVATGRPLRVVELLGGQSVYLQPFASDGRSFWTVSEPPAGEYGPVWFERWSTEAPGPPWWLLGLTAGAAGLAVIDRARQQRKEA
jgi:WD40 repeat protein